MRRREFITLLGGAVATWPTVIAAQQGQLPTVGFLHPGSPDVTGHVLAPFRKGLSEGGYIEGQNVVIEYRWAHGDNDRLPELAADLVSRHVAAIATPNSAAATLAAKAATTSIPIIFQSAVDPVQTGLVASLNRPGGNITGVSSMNRELGPKRLGLLQELLPRARRFAVLVNASNSSAGIAELQEATLAVGRQMEVLTAANSSEIEAAFAALVRKETEALIVGADAFLLTRRVQFATLATHHRVPVVYTDRQYAEAGGLMSYGTNLADLFRQTGIYTARVLKGDKPIDLPVLRPTKFEFIINLQTARTLGLQIPTTLLARADEVIE
jgi:putative ABC transport system substrate-binding protein